MAFHLEKYHCPMFCFLCLIAIHIVLYFVFEKKNDYKACAYVVPKQQLFKNNIV